MKTLLLMLIISLSVLAYRTPDIMHAIGMGAHAPPTGSHAATQAATLHPKPPRGMTALQFAELARNDPHAYQKLLESNTVPAARSAHDKLLNFLAHGAYE
jgi:hypothetical protein